MSKRSNHSKSNKNKRQKIENAELTIRSDRFYRAVDNLDHFFGINSIINVSTPFILSTIVKNELLKNGVKNISNEPFYESNKNFLVELKIVKLQPCRLGPYSGKAEFILADKFCKITKIWYDSSYTFNQVKENYYSLSQKYDITPFENLELKSINLKNKESWDKIVFTEKNPSILSDYEGFGFDAIIVPDSNKCLGNDIWLAEQLFSCFSSNIDPYTKYKLLLEEAIFNDN